MTNTLSWTEPEVLIALHHRRVNEIPEQFLSFEEAQAFDSSTFAADTVLYLKELYQEKFGIQSVL